MRRGTVGLTLALISACSVLEGQNAQQPRVNDQGPPWIQLFDGKTLNGWKKIGLHTHFEGDPPRLFGIQIEIDPRIGRHSGGLHGDARGWIAWPAPENENVIRPYDWNEMLIQVEGNRIRSRLNSVNMIDYTYPSPVNTDGVIALQLHSGSEGKMRFKDIWIRDLTKR